MNNSLPKISIVVVSFTLLCFPLSLTWSQPVPFGSDEPPVQFTSEELRLLQENDPVVKILPPVSAKPLPPQQELPPGIIVVPAYCPKGYDEIPNGAELYKVEPVQIPGEKFPTPLYVCREIGPIAK